MENYLTSKGIPKAKEVEPIKDIKDIKKIKQYLRGKDDKRDYALFVLGINIGLRAGDLLSLKIEDVADVMNGINILDKVEIIEEKTSKRKTFNINESAREALELYLQSLSSISPEAYLFRSNKFPNEPLRVDSLHRLIKTLLRDLGIKGNYGTHSLRKSFGYHVYTNNVKKNPRILHELMKVFNHSSESITLRYIGITEEVISNIYKDLNL